MEGIVRTPALSFMNETKTMSSNNLDQYEVSLFEGLHDLKGAVLYLQNIFVTRTFDSGLRLPTLYCIYYI